MRMSCSGILPLKDCLVRITIDSNQRDFYLCNFTDYVESVESLAREEIYLLPILAIRESIQDDDIQGLLIRPTVITLGEYRRIGHFMLPRLENDTLMADLEARAHLISELKVRGRELAARMCAEEIQNHEQPDETFVISIV